MCCMLSILCMLLHTSCCSGRGRMDLVFVAYGGQQIGWKGLQQCTCCSEPWLSTKLLVRHTMYAHKICCELFSSPQCWPCLQVAFYLIDLLQDSNTEVVKAADQALTVISETDEEWAAKLRALKFEAHNQVWLEACASTTPQQVTLFIH